MFDNAEHKAGRIVEAVLHTTQHQPRCLVAVAGPPAVGKSTIAGHMVNQLQNNGYSATIVPMDGFHYDNDLLQQRNRLPYKGAPDTFDLVGFTQLIAQLKVAQPVQIPHFDRARDCVSSASTLVTSAQQYIVIEGNYLLFDAPGWRTLSTYWDFSVFIAQPLEVLQQRLVQRWLDHGLTAPQAQQRAAINDIPNAKTVLQHRLPSTLAVT